MVQVEKKIYTYIQKKSLPTFELGNHPKLGQIQYGHHDNYSTV